MPYICLTCKKEFYKPTPLPKTGVYGRYGSKCPEGHLLRRLLSPAIAFASTAGGVILLYLSCGWSLWSMGEIREFTLGIPFALAAFVVVLMLLGLITGLKYRRSEEPLNRFSAQNIWHVAGAGFGLCVAIVACYFRYVSPAPNNALLTQSQAFIGRNFSVAGQVVWVNTDDRVSLFKLDNNVTVQSLDIQHVPKQGDVVWTFGRGYGEPTNRGVTLVEYYRWR